MARHLPRMHGRQPLSGVHTGKIHAPGFNVFTGNKVIIPRGSFPSVAVYDLNRTGTVVAPGEHEAPLAVDPDRMIPAPVAACGFKPVSRWRPRSLQLPGGVNGGKFPVRDGGETARHAPWYTAGKHERGRLVAKALDHDDT